MNQRPILFRQTETECLMRYAQAGESAGIIGVSGVGKSNLFNHLLDPAVQSHYLDSQPLIFLRVNFHFAADFSARSIFSLILEQFELLLEQSAERWLPAEKIRQIESYHDQLLAAGSDQLISQRFFKKAVRTLMTADSERKLIFLFDQFGDVFQAADERLFANLRGLREDYKYRLAFFVFSRQPLEQLAPLGRAREEFSELLTANQMGLKPYQSSDAFEMMERVARRQNKSLSAKQQEILFAATGGHSGLLRAATAAALNNQINLKGQIKRDLNALFDLPQIMREGQKIWASLSVEEQRLLTYVATEVKQVTENRTVVQQLLAKGILQEEGRHYRLFSALFARFIEQQKAVWDEPLYYDRQFRRILIFGKPLEKPLTPTEMQIFLLLYERLGEPISNQEIKEAVWSDKEADQPLKTNIYRLRRKLEPDSKHPRFLVTVAGYGYQLSNE